MIRSFKTVATLVLCFYAMRGSAAASASIADISWISGQWSLRSPDFSTEVYYTTAEAGTMMGVFRIVEAGNLSFFEYQRITEEAGTLTLHISPMGVPGVSFTLREVGNGVAVFENSENAFPRTVTFSLDITQALHIAAAGIQDGQPLTLELVAGHN